MKSLIAFAIALIPMCGMGQELSLDTENATVSFLFEAENVNGSVSGIESTITLNLSDLSSSVIKGSADVSTISTGIKMRDKHLRSDDYFDAEKFPKMTFESSSFKKDGDTYLATGNLTIKGTKKEVTFRMHLEEKALVMKTTINADDFDVSPKSREKSTVHVTVTVPVNE